MSGQVRGISMIGNHARRRVHCDVNHTSEITGGTHMGDRKSNWRLRQQWLTQFAFTSALAGPALGT